MKSNFFMTFLLFVILFILDTMLFGGTGSLSSIGALTAQVLAFILLAQQGNVDAGVTGTQALLPVVLLLIAKIAIYIILAMAITFVFGLITRRK